MEKKPDKKKSKLGMDPWVLVCLLVFVVMLGYMIHLWNQPEPPSLMVINTHTEKMDYGSYCEAEIGGDVFNIGGITATAVSIRCDAGPGTKRPMFTLIDEIAGKETVPFNVTVPLTSCYDAPTDNCVVAACANC